ncbi:hypothetical protein JKP88DRAFT_337645 [Tribonema minus]|uniref:Uncharacterized protein n=1 Tax=Tribonema minus TaxID=303371 RepID=A0A836C827_9STRA|nr:hypothetical protein JKP88DRAFT_337645 [Tribonema minus]
MTATQGMMLAERPSGLSNDAGTAGGAPSIGNYKGVMLCNRPFGGVSAAARETREKGAVSATAGRFVTGVVQTEVGYSSAQAASKGTRVVCKKVRKDNALARHRRWLADLQRTKDALEKQYIEELEQKEEAARKFSERESRMRRMYIATGSVYPDRHHEPHAPADVAGSDDEREHIYDEDKAQQQSHGSSPEADDHREDRKHKSASARPKWALTEAKAAAVDQEAEDAEVEELLAFTKSLDFDKYLRDAEVQAMIDQVKRRIQELEREAAAAAAAAAATEGENGDPDEASDGAEDDAEAAMAERILRLTAANLKRVDGAPDGDEPDDTASVLSMARTVLTEGGRSVRSVHSAKSLAAVVERAQTRLVTVAQQQQQQEGRSPVANVRESGFVVKVAEHKDDGGLRLGGKNTVSNLPYMHRNPAV